MIEWREEDHPRVPAGNPEGGQFTEKASAEARRAAGLETEAEIRRETYRKFQRYVEQKAEHLGQDYLSHEEAWIVDDEGNHEEAGESVQHNAMMFSQSEKRKMEGMALVHNHPVPSSFSWNDIKFGIDYGLKEMAVVTSEGLHIVRFKATIDYYEGGRRRLGEAIAELHRDLTMDLLHEYDHALKMGAMTEVNASKDFYENTIRVMNLLDKDANVGSFIDYEYMPWE